jgi:soluble lytic murein transglycosylase-like protein
MNHKLIKPIPVVLFLSLTAFAQTGREPGPSIQERARALDPLIVESARRYGIDVRILEMICFVESRFRTDAVSPKGARGLMQFMPETAAHYGLKNPNDPREAIDAAAHYLRDLLERFGGRVDLAVAAYNAGEGAVESFRTGRPLLLRTGKVINARGMITGGVPPYPETQSYVKQILESLTFRSRAKSTSDSLTQKRDAIRQNDFTLDTDSVVSDQSKNRRPASSSFIEIKDQL